LDIDDPWVQLGMLVGLLSCLPMLLDILAAILRRTDR
jgi:hypothetical protein